MLTLVMRLLARLPLPVFHFPGWALGWLVWLLSPRMRRITRANLASAGYAGAPAGRASIGEAGKGVLELVPVWFRAGDHAARLVRGIEGRGLIDAARAAGRGILFVTPHLGCFEVTAQWYAAQYGPMTALYSPPKSRLLQALVAAGRAKPELKLALPDLRGIRALLRALRRGEAIGILPDQTPGRGEGEWAEFFGRPAYTMTLVQRLAGASGAPILLAWAERLPAGGDIASMCSPCPK